MYRSVYGQLGLPPGANMATPQAEDVCCALEPLRAVVDSLRLAALGDVPPGGEGHKLARRARPPVKAALPALLRPLLAASDGAPSCAYSVLPRPRGSQVL